MNAPAISARGLSKLFSGTGAALQGVDLDIPPGTFVSLLGPSGCGKSTLLRLIAGLDAPSAGRLVRNGEARLSFVFQEAHLLPWRNVLDNVLLPLELRGELGPGTRAEAEAWLRRLGLGEFMGARPHQLSGGMKMRVSLARALVTRPQVLLLDEPFAALDELTRQVLDLELRALWRSSGMTVVFVTHSVAEAVFLSERALVMSPRPGRILLDQPIDLPDARDARTRATQDFARLQLGLVEALEAAA